MKRYIGDISSLYDDLQSKASSGSARETRFLRGSKMKTYPTFFDEVSAVLQFPPYFGENWNAYDECMADLSWLDCKSITLCIIDFNLVLTNEQAEPESWIEHLQKVIDEKAVGDEFSEALDIQVILHSNSALPEGAESSPAKRAIDS